MRSRGLVTLAVVILLVTAGCTGVDEETEGPTLTPAPVPADESHEQVVTPSIPTESLATFTPENTSATGPLGLRDQHSVRTALWRLRTVLAVEAIEPSVTRQFGLSDSVDSGPLGLSEAVTRSLGVATEAGGTPPGRVDSPNATISLLRGMFDPARLEYNLAYLHSRLLVDRLGWSDALATQENGTVDDRLVAVGLGRGGAAFAADAYAEQYGLSVDSPVREWGFGWLESPRFARAGIAAGEAYARSTARSPGDLRRVYVEPPNTTEQLLHGFPPGSETPRPLDVTVAGDTDWTRTATEQFGELGIRTVLSSRLDADVADRAARGWGNDRLLAFEDGAATGVVWATTWDQASYAEQFAAAFDAYAGAGDTLQATAIERPGAKTVVVAAGHPSFVDGVSLAGENASVSITLSE
ncbi:membrane lipoprotein [Halorhabdus tiamatea SARL4B]|uniref:Membrane lipoprotein n=1 Tax=Halorhabdus tiamatea SARL4B TaxID=1033806 RepID=F7PLY8_9EURY|nr:hypothetical protein [Halorhabdus tiamatea]ERJ06402.1 membrane lipoprotein [Halorhabdus tiamatea SARL4B]CCQ34572.1 conserved hypothetical protein [Halorhabdus tiamatea SARL4B]